MCRIKEDYWIQAMAAKAYANKISNARERNLDFDLSLQSYVNMYRAKKCFYTGVTLTKGFGDKTNPTDITIDRVDSSKGYVKGNVVACCKAFNEMKGFFEGNNEKLTAGLDVLGLIKSIKKLDKRLQEVV